MIEIALYSVAAGFAVGAPVGPTGAICTSYAMRGDLPASLAGGLGSSLALGIWGALAGLGMSALGGWVPIDALRIVGGLLIVAIGVATWTRAPAARAEAKVVGPLAVLTLTFTVVISNPAGLAVLAAIVAGPLADVPWSPWISGALVGGGVTVGTLAAFGLVMPLMFKLGERVGDRVRVWLLRFLATGMTLVGIGIIAMSVRGML